MRFECFEYCMNLLVNMQFFRRIPALEDSSLGKILALKILALGRFWPWEDFGLEDSGLGKILALKILALGRFWP
jgi:hypothetical protein